MERNEGWLVKHTSSALWAPSPGRRREADEVLEAEPRNEALLYAWEVVDADEGGVHG